MGQFSPFEILMLVCFGASWPFSVYKTWKTKTCQGKSMVFLVLVLIGYLGGIIHKVLYSRDFVIALYALNTLLVFTDLMLCAKYTKRAAATPTMRETV